jgi:glycosyltransferase involved in cell wall biosynthesis
MSSPKISVITPSYNQGHFIEETIQSILNQGYSNLEYIIIDGGSTDNTVEIIKKYEKKISYWVSEKDSGQSEAVNKGFRKATGDIICWINSDDILMPGSLNKVASSFTQHPDWQIVKGYTVVIDVNSNILYNLFMLPQKKWYARKGIYYIAQPSLFWRRSVLDKIGLLREEFHSSMDQEFMIRMFENNLKIGQVNKILAGFRLHETSKTFLRDNQKVGLKEKQQKADDTRIISQLHGAEYMQKPKFIFKTFYRLEKLIRGVYLRSILFMLRCKVKNVKKLTHQTSMYL